MIARTNLKRHAASQKKSEKDKELSDSKLKVQEMRDREFRKRQKREHDIDVERSHDITN